MTKAMGTIEIVKSQKGGVLILKLRGRLDSISSPSLQNVVVEAVDDKNVKFLLDLSSLQYLSSSGMKVLLMTSRMLESLSGKLVLCAVPQEVRDVLKMTGGLPLFEIAKNEAEGLLLF